MKRRKRKAKTSKQTAQVKEALQLPRDGSQTIQETIKMADRALRLSKVLSEQRRRGAGGYGVKTLSSQYHR